MTTETVTVLTWNIQGEVGVGAERLERQLAFLDRQVGDLDVVLLQAVHYEGSPEDGWEGQLGALIEFFTNHSWHVVHTGDWAHELFHSTVQPHADITGAHNRCNLTASRWPVERTPLRLRNRGEGKPRKLTYYTSQFPEKLLVIRIDTTDADAIASDFVQVWNVGIANGAAWGEAKLHMLETVHGRVHLETAKTDTPVVL